MKFKKKKIIAAIVLAGILGTGKTSAYLTDYDQAVNQVSVGHNTTEIVENFPTPTPKPVSENPRYPKTVQVSNAASGGGFSVDCFVRVSLSYSNYDIGKAVTLTGLDTSNWIYKDGYYYYKNILKKNQTTTPLFTGFTIDSAKVDTSCRDSIYDFSIQVYEESIQCGEFTSYSQAWDYYLNSV